MSATLYLGLMSGTSMDGVDAVLAEFDAGRFAGLRHTHHLDYDAGLRGRLLELAHELPPLTLAELGRLEGLVADRFAQAALGVLAAAGLQPAQIRAIGSHGQTVFHDPSMEPPATLQLGDPSRIAARTGITTVADFRRRDVALGGQGAPLVPAFHHGVFADAAEPRCVVNLGGIANVTILPDLSGESVRGFDTGPANALMDQWSERHLGKTHDDAGAFAATGRVHAGLLEQLLEDPYFSLPPPKSTGRSYFNLPWAQRRFPELLQLPPADVQATFAELTAASVAGAIADHAPGCRRVLLCGGGARNDFLVSRLRALLPRAAVQATDAYGLDADWVEAAAFAWLAMRCLEGLPGNLPAVTGASQPAVLGGIY
ncbi:MAG: anhydro-N-acetylmuramic acid kinase, partial [Nevskia sp.]|nr:anhydro-N-acetylmuramic acid kinase [Nevskia sp.]